MDATTNEAQRLSNRTRIGYAVGDFGGSVVFQTVTLFILFYFTDVFLLSATAAAMVLAAAKLWNAFCDPMMGFMADRKPGRLGQKRPFLLFGAVPLGLAFFLLVSSPDFGPTGKVAWALVTFLLFSTCFSLVGVPYGALTANMTSDNDERSVLTVFRMVFAILAILVIAGVTRPFVALFPTPREGFRATGVIYGVVAALCTWVAFAATKERVPAAEAEKVPFKDNLRVVSENKPFIFLTLAVIAHLTAFNLLASMVNYYFKYYLNNDAGITVAFLCLFVTSAASLPVWNLISKRTGRKAAFNLGLAVVGVVLVILFLLDRPGPVASAALFVTAGFGLATVYLFPWTMIPDTVEYSEWKTGLRREGILYGFFYFGFKVSAALAGLIAGTGLGLSGYVANSTQTAGALLGIRLLMGVVPVVLIVVGIILMSFYSISEKSHAEMMVELKARRGGTS